MDKRDLITTRLHQIVDAISGETLYYPPTSSAERKKINDLILLRSGQAICFNCGSPEDFFQFRPIPELFRLPFPTTYFELAEDRRANNPCIVGVLATEITPSTTEFLTLAKLPLHWTFIGFCDVTANPDGTFSTDTFPASGPGNEMANITWKVIAKFLSALNCVNVTRKEHVPDQKLQDARARRGKQPLFSTWTLALQVPREAREVNALGGSHASPRVHLRRGHARQFSPGRWTWVQPHVVGHGPGIVHKDYAIHPHLRGPL